MPDELSPSGDRVASLARAIGILPRRGDPRPLPRATTPRRTGRTFAAMETSIEVGGLTKRYRAALAVDGLSFTAPAGRVTGFVGPNGAGKSTTMRMILGLAGADAGTALVNGRPYGKLEAPLRQIGALLEARSLHPGR